MMQLPSIPPKAAAELRSVCAELSLPDNATEALLASARGIRFQESERRNNSAPRRKDALKEIAKKARELCDDLQALEGEDRLNVHLGFESLQIRMHLDPPDPMREVFIGSNRNDLHCENVLLLGDVLLSLEGVASEAVKSVSGPMKGGAPSVLKDRAYHVNEVAYWAHKHGIVIGRSRPFVMLCSVFFKAAGISGGTDPDPEPAIRFFVTNYLPAFLEMWDDKEGKQRG